jgi:hypothetical protein
MNRARIIALLLLLGSISGIGQAFSQQANQAQQSGEKNGALAKGDLKLSIELEPTTLTLRDISKIKISVACVGGRLCKKFRHRSAPRL